MSRYSDAQDDAMRETRSIIQEDKAADLKANPAALPITEDAIEAREILDGFLFEEINNNRIPNENRWSITWAGDEFLLLDNDTEKVYNFRVSILPGTLSESEIKNLGDDQEWWD